MNLSVIIPTFNESKRIVGLVEYLLKHSQEFVQEIIVVDAPDSSDDTLDLLKGRPRVKPYKATATSRAIQMNEGARLAKGDTLYFVHADALPPESYAKDIYNAINAGYPFGIFCYQFDSNSKLLKINAYTTKFNGVFAGGGDQTLFIQKSIFQEMSGFNTKLAIMEDFDFFWRLGKAGHKHCIVQKSVLVSARKYSCNSYLRVNIVNMITFFLFKLGYPPKKLKVFYKKAIRSPEV